MRRRLKSILRNEHAATLVEYSLLLVLIALASATALSTTGCGLSLTFLRAGHLIGQ
jgi:Flp pilus assembly pilin Flp